MCILLFCTIWRCEIHLFRLLRLLCRVDPFIRNVSQDLRFGLSELMLQSSSKTNHLVNRV
jgi:hypothetical protein